MRIRDRIECVDRGCGFVGYVSVIVFLLVEDV